MIEQVGQSNLLVQVNFHYLSDLCLSLRVSHYAGLQCLLTHSVLSYTATKAVMLNLKCASCCSTSVTVFSWCKINTEVVGLERNSW